MAGAEHAMQCWNGVDGFLFLSRKKTASHDVA